MLEISDLRRRRIVLSEQQKKGTDQLRSYSEADLRLCFCIGKNLVLSRRGSCIIIIIIRVIKFVLDNSRMNNISS